MRRQLVLFALVCGFVLNIESAAKARPARATRTNSRNSSDQGTSVAGAKLAQQPQVLCHPYVRYPDVTRGISAQWSIASLCRAYNFPTKLSANGVIGILELGGGWLQSDLDAFSALYNMPKIAVNNVSVDGTVNSPGNDDDADAEVTLDIECAAAAYFYATGEMPTINVYFAANNAASYVRVINAALADKCDVLSICWGDDELSWQTNSPGVAALIESAAQTATAAGLVILASAGDNSSSDDDTGTNVDLPASCPHVIGCGGTSKTTATETAWGDGVATDSGTGGGFSAIFPLQSFQVAAPTAPSGLGRMVPDIAANADPNTGVIIVVDGVETLIGGTSVVPPMYAGLFAALGKQLGFITPTLWLNRSDFVDITTGSNGAYSATVGPDACTGLGVPNGTSIAALFGKTVITLPTNSDITATFSAGTLTIQGDNNNNRLIIRERARKGILEVEGLHGTTINGTSSYSVTVEGSYALNITLGSGNDDISFQTLSTVNTTSTVLLGAGNDKATILLCDIGTLNIDGGAGTNFLFAVASRFANLTDTDFANRLPRRLRR